MAAQLVPVHLEIKDAVLADRYLFMTVHLYVNKMHNNQTLRKWLPPPLRKLSQGKVDKVVSTSSSAASTAAAATVNSGIPLASTSLTTVTTATTTTTTTAISSITVATTGTTTTTTPTTTAAVKNTTTVATVTPSGKNIGSLKKGSSDKRFKLPSGAVEQKRAVTVSAGNVRIVSEFEPLTGAEEVEREEEEEEEEEEEHVEISETISATYDDGEGNVFHEQNGTEDGEDDLELPPPMKPITEPILVAAGNGPPGSTIPDELPGKRASECSSKILDGATTADLAEIEQIVKERMEQHTENQERHSLMRTERTTAGGRGSSDGENNYARATSPSHVSEESDPEIAALTKRQFVIRELVDTERDYVNDLKQIVEGYMMLMRDPESDIPLPEDLRAGKDKMVFGNIEAIYEWHRDFFLKALENCIKSPEELGPLFKRYERKLHMYVVYCQNKPVSEYIVSEYIYTYFEELRQKLGHRLQLCDLLIKPVQRITKYQLLLREALRLTERTQRLSEIEGLKAAVHVMRVIPKAANDMMDVGRLQGFDGKITAQGKLLLHGPLLVSEISSMPTKGKEWHVFLFEQNIIFSEAVGKKTQFTNPAYIYKAHIQVNKMSLEDSYDDPDKFMIRSTDPRKPGLGFYCSVVEENGPRRQEWVDTITDILQTQRDFLKAIQSPIAYQKELTKDPLDTSAVS
ncbi:kalirin isoform X2 [Vespula maculifrons]|uniref:Kalirin isoform X2 n=1 Tax=Vespula maculifrons TaxID=7453 RepID=A0ABD2BUF9_VESMC